MTDNTVPDPGWYEDPTGRGHLRYWDGNSWTEHIHEHPEQADQHPAADEPAPDPGEQTVAFDDDLRDLVRQIRGENPEPAAPEAAAPEPVVPDAAPAPDDHQAAPRYIPPPPTISTSSPPVADSPAPDAAPAIAGEPSASWTRPAPGGPPPPSAATRAATPTAVYINASWGRSASWVAFLIAGGILLAAVLPFISDFGQSSSLTETGAGRLVFLGMAGVAAAGGMLALADRVEGVMLSVGVGVVFAFFGGILVRIYTLVSEFGDLSPGAGYVTLIITMAFVGIATLIVLSRLAPGPDEPIVEAWVGVLAMFAGLVAALGILLPPQEGISVWDHLSAGDGWIGTMTIAIMVAPIVASLILATARSRAAAGLAAGAFTGHCFLWAPNAARMGAVTFNATPGSRLWLLGGGAIAGFAICSVGMFATWKQTRNGRQVTDTRSPALLWLPAIALAALLLFVLIERSNNDAEFNQFGSETISETVKPDTHG